MLLSSLSQWSPVIDRHLKSLSNCIRPNIPRIQRLLDMATSSQQFSNTSKPIKLPEAKNLFELLKIECKVEEFAESECGTQFEQIVRFVLNYFNERRLTHVAPMMMQSATQCWVI